jgi:hypothetical protein
MKNAPQRSESRHRIRRAFLTEQRSRRLLVAESLGFPLLLEASTSSDLLPYATILMIVILLHNY